MPALRRTATVLACAVAFPLAICLPAWSQAGGGPAYTPAAHDVLIQAWRAGGLSADEGASRLAFWLADAAAQARLRIASDLAVLGASAADPAPALAALRAVAPRDTEDYALLPLARVARSAGDSDLQRAAVAELARRSPQAWDTRVQQGWLAVDGSRLEEAVAITQELALRPSAALMPQAAHVLELRAGIAESRGDAALALLHYRALAKVEPTHRYAARAPVFLLQRLQAESAAAAALTAASFSVLERAELGQAQAGEALRWAVIERDRHGLPPRYEALDQTLDRMRALDAALRAEAAGAAADSRPWSAVRARAAADWMVALFERGLHAQVLDRLQAASSEGLPLSFHAYAAAGGACARLRRPACAVTYYERAIALGGSAIPMPSELHMGLAYALIDTGRLAQARTLADQLVQLTPPTLRLAPEPGRPNPEFGDVRALRALVDLEQADTAAAERTLGELAAVAPLNVSYLTAWSRALRDLDQPQLALAVLEARARIGEESPVLRAAYGDALLAEGRIGEGRAIIELLDDEASSSATGAARRALQTVTRPRLEVDASVARDGGTLANREAVQSWRLWSGRTDDGLRGFVHQRNGAAEVGASRAGDSRTGAGVEWLRPQLKLTAELASATWPRRREGVAIDAAWRPRDAWELSAAWDSNSFDVPWRARRAGIAGSGGRIRANLLQGTLRAGGSLSRLELTDENVRTGAQLDWRHDWPAGDLLWTTALSLEAGGFRRASPVYFSPLHEAAADAEVSVRWLGWRDGAARLRHVAAAHAGSYRQAGFGRGPMTGASYAHEWDWGMGRNLRYGLALNQRPYDGVQERRRELFVQLGVPLP